jgi:uncharacterized protein (TIGR02284 family)
MENNKTIGVLNDLVEINNDRIIGYETAIKEVEDSELQHLFKTFIGTSEKCASDLRKEIVKLGGETETGTRNTGKLHRLWMDFKNTFSENNKASVLDSCEFGDDTAVTTYQDALKNNVDELDIHISTIISTQEDLIKSELLEIQKLKLAEETKE